MKTRTQLEDMLVEMLTGAVGGTADQWRQAIGPVTVYPLATRPTPNWSVQAGGSATEQAAIDMAAEIVRAEHPYGMR